MNQDAIKVSNVTMRFNLEREKTDNVKEFFIKKMKRKLQIDAFIALEDVSFSVKKGEIFGLIVTMGAERVLHFKIIHGIILYKGQCRK